jgi:DnaJ-class molecular chaperone
MEIVKYREIIIEQRPDAFLVKCVYCKGLGTVGDFSKKLCPVCDGAGKVLLRIPPSFDCDVGVLRCAFCKGQGGIGDFKRRECPVCDGVGALVKCFPRVVCSTCEGSGKIGDFRVGMCASCGGAGSVWLGALKQY